ncbi:hypothetical protein ON010_g9909 [Phytophthora cinnamomi]|nr:hypothetical protein ON010_g9909 [Phytophthora cinnamomi]
MELVDGQRVVRGTVKRAYPLQSLRQASSDGAAESANGELGTFGPGVGPGRGLVALEWEAGAETEERVSCAVVAERDILKKTLERKPRLFTFPHSLSVEVAFEEPQRLPQSDQLKYLPSKTISTRDLHTAQPTRQTQIQVQPQPKKKPNYGKRTLGEAKLTSPMYRYSSLAELVDGYADIYGVVVNVTLPKKTSGRDFCMTVSVIDESCPTRAEAIQINIFYPMIAQMPKIKVRSGMRSKLLIASADYVCLWFGSTPRGSRYLVVREQTDGKLEQLTCSDNWTFEASDEQRVRQLITWARNSLAEDATLPQGCALAPKLLAELRFAENFIDLVVRVLHLDDSEEPTRLIVWDGSGSLAESDPTLVRALEDHGASVPTNGMLKELIMSSCWTVVRDMGFVDGMLGQWCRFRNLAVGTDEPVPGTANPPGGREILRFREVTSLVLMPDFTLDVNHRLSLTNESSPASTMPSNEGGQTEVRQDQKHTAASLARVTTVIPDHIKEKAPVASLQEILRSTKTPRKFHCCARVRSIWPADVEKICKLKPGSHSEYIYSFALTVEDGSDSLNIIVYGKDAGFLSYPPDPAQPTDPAGEAEQHKTPNKKESQYWYREHIGNDNAQSRKPHLLQPVKLIVLRHVSAHAPTPHRVLDSLGLHELLRHRHVTAVHHGVTHPHGLLHLFLLQLAQTLHKRFALTSTDPLRVVLLEIDKRALHLSVVAVLLEIKLGETTHRTGARVHKRVRAQKEKDLTRKSGERDTQDCVSAETCIMVSSQSPLIKNGEVDDVNDRESANTPVETVRYQSSSWPIRVVSSSTDSSKRLTRINTAISELAQNETPPAIIASAPAGNMPR